MSKKVELKVGDKAPEFCLPDKDKKEMCLKDLRGKYVVLYFYPKDNTPGCTTEAIGFTNVLPDLQELDATVVGVSPDSPESHKKFIDKKSLTITLLSDEDHKIMDQYNAWGKKKFRGKEYMGVIRSTYLIDPDGKIVNHWPKVSPKGHAEDVKSVLNDLIAKS
ncbi:MAG: thiol peroxidase, thioredoxin-dependent [Promethearchaeota archaeon]|nr:MAG: thiol peroxidase, thioredoxin-dependent [Candidatus Lokiarchaeota archaeon]